MHERVRDKAAEQVISVKDVSDETIIPQLKGQGHVCSIFDRPYHNDFHYIS